MARVSEENGQALRDEVQRFLTLLEGPERFWAFPGKVLCKDLRRALKKGWFGALAGRTAYITRLLQSGAYRRRAVNEIVRDFEEPESTAPARSDDKSTQTENRPYFEVLVVEARR